MDYKEYLQEIALVCFCLGAIFLLMGYLDSINVAVDYIKALKKDFGINYWGGMLILVSIHIWIKSRG